MSLYDDLIVAAPTVKEHDEAIAQVDVKKLYGATGIRPDPNKVDALQYVTAPKNKDELVSFLCIMQSNANFITNFARKSAPLRPKVVFDSNGQLFTKNALKT